MIGDKQMSAQEPAAQQQEAPSEHRTEPLPDLEAWGESTLTYHGRRKRRFRTKRPPGTFSPYRHRRDDN